MTAAEELLQEGRQQGYQQAMQETVTTAEELRRYKIKFVGAMLRLGSDASFIASAVELPLAEVEAIISEINRAEAI